MLEAESRIRAADARMRTAEAFARQVLDCEQAGANEQVRLSAARRDRDVLKTLLGNAIGMEAGIGSLEPVAGADLLVQAGEALPQAYRDRPELKAAELRTQAAQSQYQAVRGQRMPKLSAAVDYGLLGAGPDRSIGTYTVGASLTVPLFTSGRLAAEERTAILRRQQAETEQRQYRLHIAQEVRQAIVELDAARQTLHSARRSTAAAREVLELTRLRVETGLATSLDTVVAQGRLAEAEDQEIRTRYQLQLARARVARARGNVLSFLDP